RLKCCRYRRRMSRRSRRAFRFANAGSRAPRASSDRLGVEAEADSAKLLNLVAQPRGFLELEVARVAIHLLLELLDLREDVLRAHFHARSRAAIVALTLPRASARSEERRVGKEGRSRGEARR